MSRVLLVSHEASRSGAPRVAALVAECLVDQGHQVRIVSQRPGPLITDLSAIAPTRVEPCWRIRRRIWSRVGWVRDRLGRTIELAVALGVVLAVRPEVVYVNSSSAAAYVRVARLLRRPVILHLHESGDVLRRFLDRVGIRELPDPDVRLVACSPSVAAALVAAGAHPDDVHLLLSIPDGRRVRSGAAHASPTNKQGEVVIGACGAVEDRKGVDLWLAAAQAVRDGEAGERFRFVWVGDGDPPPEADTLPGVEFQGPSDDPYATMAGFDIMTLPSRDDPFPLVVMEAMLLAKPVVAFDVGGVRHQLGDTGVLVSPGDVADFASQVALLGSDPARRDRLGAEAAARAEKHFSRAAFDAVLVDLIAKL